MGFKRENRSAVFLIVILFILVGVAVYLGLSLRADMTSTELEKDHVLKILFVVDDGKDALFTDVILYYPVSHKCALFNIPGNTGAIYESLGRVDRIDSIYREKGIAVYKNEVEKLVGTELQYYITTNIDNFKALTDLLGGLMVFVRTPVDYVDESGNRWLLPSGAILLDGDKIQTYLEYKLEGDSLQDIEERRQDVMIAFLRALSNNYDVMDNKNMFSKFSTRLSTNANPKIFQHIMSELSFVITERLAPQTVTGSNRKVGVETLLFPYYDGDLIKEAVQKSTTQLTSQEDGLTSRVYVLEIQNGTLVQGLARNTAALLQSVGYDVLSTLNADSSDYEKTVIINHIGNAAVAKSLGDFIRCTNIVDDTVAPEMAGNETDLMVDFTLILGKDFDGRYVRSK